MGGMSWHATDYFLTPPVAAGHSAEEIQSYKAEKAAAEEEPALVAAEFDRTKIGEDTDGRISAGSAAVMEGDSDWRPCLSVQGGRQGIHR